MELKKVSDLVYVTECGEYAITQGTTENNIKVWIILVKPATVLYAHEDFQTVRNKLEEIMEITEIGEE